MEKQKQSLTKYLRFQDFQKGKMCGCYIRDPHLHLDLTQKPKTNILIPLQHINYQIELTNGLASVTLEQTYFNPTQKFLQVNFSFPIDPNSCIYKFCSQFGNKRIQGVIKQKQQAKKEYTQAIKQGKQAVYAEIDQKSNDIMNLQVGNILPQQKVKITVSYLSELTVDQNTFYNFHLPSTISPRYMNYVPPVQNKVAQKVGQNKQSVKGSYTWNFKVTINTTRKIIFNKSPTHDLTLLNQHQNGTEVTLVMNKQCIPNKDFSFVYTTEDFHLPSYVLGRTDVSSTVMLSFIPKFCQLTVDDAYKASTLHTPLQTDMNAVKGEYIFLLDRSGSMGGSRIKKAVEALCLFLKSLPEDTYFNVISFGSGSQLLHNQSIKYNDAILNKSIESISKMTADMGGTQIYFPLQNIFNSKHVKGYPRQIFLLTDGGVSNTQGVIKLVQENTKFSRVHSIGIGNGCSEALIKGCASKGKGKFIFISDDENPSDKIIGLLEESLTPVISKIDLEYEKNIVESIFPNPASIPYILKNQVVNFYITFKGQLQKNTQFKFSYQDSMNKQLFSSNIKVQSQSANFPFVDKMAHSKIIKTLENASKKNNLNIEEQMFYVKVVDKKAQAIKESVKHQILSQYTAFICVQKQLVDGKYQQIKDKGKQKIKIQNIQPIQNQDQFQQNLKMCREKISLCSSSFSGKQQQLKCSVPMSSMKLSAKKQKKSSGGGVLGFLGGVVDGVTNLFFSNQSSKPTSYTSYTSQSRNAQMFAPSMKRMQIKRQNQYQCKKMEKYEEEDQDDRLDQIINMLDDVQQKEDSKKRRSKVAPKKEAFQQKKQEKDKKDKIKIQKQTENIISIVVKQQNADGSWTNLKLLESIYKESWIKILEQLKNMDANICCTYLIAKWIQKNHSQKQYALLVKKAFSWIKKFVKVEELKHLDKFVL